MALEGLIYILPESIYQRKNVLSSTFHTALQVLADLGRSVTGLEVWGFLGPP